MKGKWERITINLSPEDYRDMRLLASLKGQTVAAFVRYLLKMHISLNKPVSELLDKARKESTAKPS